MYTVAVLTEMRYIIAVRQRRGNEDVAFSLGWQAIDSSSSINVYIGIPSRDSYMTSPGFGILRKTPSASRILWVMVERDRLGEGAR